MMKKTIATVFCLAICGLLVSGCSKKEETATPAAAPGQAADTVPATPVVSVTPAPTEPPKVSTGKYADVRQVNEAFASNMETYVAALDKAGSASDIAKAMNGFSDSIEKLVPKMKAVMDKYPELKGKETMPEELKDLEDRSATATQKMMGAMMKIGPYMMDPEVKKAQERMSKTMAGLQDDAEAAK
ncbi:hypothetical protein ACFL6U_19015 [Planctomycetota bacterium]